MNRQPFLGLFPDRWIVAKDGDPTARALFRQHYSYKPYADGRDPALFVGPGEKLVLLTADASALFVWRRFISGDGQQGINLCRLSQRGFGTIERSDRRGRCGRRRTLARRAALHLRQPAQGAQLESRLLLQGCRVAADRRNQMESAGHPGPRIGLLIVF